MAWNPKKEKKKREVEVHFCRACDKRNDDWLSYDDKRKRVLNAWDDILWIQCDYCDNWFHFPCVDLEPYQDGQIDVFSCKLCEKTHGNSTEYEMCADNRKRYLDTREIGKRDEVGTKKWIDDFRRYKATKCMSPPPDKVIIFENGRDFRNGLSRYEEWTKVILIKNNEGLGMKMLKPGSSDLNEMCRFIGAKRMVQAIDVYGQTTVEMSLGRYRDLLQNSTRSRLYNILSIECSQYKILKDKIRPPSIVDDLSWASRYWPEPRSSRREEACDPAHSKLRPRVEVFALMGMGGSFTDFHVDFGGSSVWYHVYKGRKVFYLVEPTKDNLDMYQEKEARGDPTEDLFEKFGADKIWRVEVEEGYTLLMPSGYIHAVYTPEDSLVFGGNFLHDLSVSMQYEVFLLEKRCRAGSIYRFPDFQLVNCYVARSFTKQLRAANEKEGSLPDYKMQGAKTLVEAMSGWLKEEEWEGEEKATDPFIYGESRADIFNALKKEYDIMVNRVGEEVADGPRLKRDLIVEDTEEEGDSDEEEEMEGNQPKRDDKDEASNESSQRAGRGTGNVRKRSAIQKASISPAAKGRKTNVEKSEEEK